MAEEDTNDDHGPMPNGAAPLPTNAGDGDPSPRVPEARPRVPSDMDDVEDEINGQAPEAGDDALRGSARTWFAEDYVKPDWEDELQRIESASTLPNVHTAAYFAGMACKETIGSPDHTALVTTANAVALQAWNDGLDLSDLDKVSFQAVKKEFAYWLEIEGKEGSVSLPIISRPTPLCEPWDGTYSIATVAEKRRE